FVYKFLKHIPIIGWIVDHVFDGAAWILGYLTGAILDFVVDTTINTLINTLGRAALSIFYTPNFDVYKLSQKDLSDKVGLALKSGQVLSIYNGREGELELRLSFDDLIPAQVISQNLLPLDQPKEPVVTPPPVPGLSDLKTYSVGDFLPAFILSMTNFGNTTERFSIVSTVNTPYNGTKVYSGSFTLNIFLQNNQWALQKALTLSTSASDSTNENSTIIYSNTFQPLSLDIKTVYTDSNGANTNVFHETITNDLQAMKSQASIKNNSFELVTQTVPILAGPSLDFPEFWIYRLAHTNTAAIKPGKFGRLSVSSPYNYNNWTRIIPVEIKSVTDSPIVINGSGGTPVTLPAVKVIANDEEADYELVILKSGGLYSATIAQQDCSVVIKTA
ncbi:MAG: hypothetical protein JST32_08530, partial [Bacteroidetes bacterium]|nr:hypothetical protein [Bacteroidota bacterium]